MEKSKRWLSLEKNIVQLKLDFDYFYKTNEEIFKELQERKETLIENQMKHKKELKELKREIPSARKRKELESCSQKQQKRIKAEIGVEFKKIIENYNIKSKFFDLKTIEKNGLLTNQVNILDSHEEEETKFDPKLLLYVKDTVSLSDKSYKLIRKLCAPAWPTFYQVEKERKALNSQIPIKRHEDGNVSCSIESKLKSHLSMHQALYENLDCINLKLSFDGTKIGSNLYVLNQMFSIVDAGHIAKTSKGNFSIGMYSIPSQTRQNIKDCFDEINKEIESLKTIKLKDKEIKINYMVCCDWKMQANLLGLLAANSNYPCIWCKCKKDMFHDSSQVWSISDAKLGARSFSDMVECMKNKTAAARFGYNEKPLLSQVIPWKNYMIDMLHLFLRISDRLIDNLLDDIVVRDEIIIVGFSDTSAYPCLSRLEKFINDTCGFKFEFDLSDKKKLKICNLKGPQKHKIFSKINIKDILGNHPKADTINFIWEEFYNIYNSIKKKELDSKKCKEATNRWLKEYLNVYQTETVTPYIHAFVFHLHEFIELYGDIDLYTLEGSEKFNDICTTYYFRSSNRNDALYQMMCKRNRLELNDFSIPDTDADLF